jgi:hypothetical protein
MSEVGVAGVPPKTGIVLQPKLPSDQDNEAVERLLPRFGDPLPYLEPPNRRKYLNHTSRLYTQRSGRWSIDSS